jgi:hypothetical protein
MTRLSMLPLCDHSSQRLEHGSSHANGSGKSDADGMRGGEYRAPAGDQEPLRLERYVPWVRVFERARTSLGAGQPLSDLQVGVCVRSSATASDGGADNLTLFDIWTSGTLGSAAVGTGSSAGTAVQPVQFN